MSTTPLTILHGGHRKTMRIGANDSMSTVVQLACREFRLDPGSSNLVLKHKRTVVDLSQPFRLTGIPQNATLELLEEAPTRRRGAGGAAGSASGAGQVRVAMRLPGGARVQAAFPADTTLLGLLEWWAGRGEIDAGVIHQGPSLQFMRTAYGAENLGSTTLRSIGLVTGSAMFALSLASSGATSAAAPSSVSAAPLPPPPASGPSEASAQEEADIAEAIARSAAEARSTPATGVGGSENDAAPPKAAGTPPAPSSSSEMMDQEKTLPSPALATATARTAGSPPLPPPPAGGAAAATASVSSMDVAAAGELGRQVQGGSGASGEEQGSAEDAMEAEAPSLPAMGIEVCRAALKSMEAAHFDADSEACVTTLTKVIDNVVHRPGDSRTRQIRCGNTAFQQKVGRITGGIAFLEGVGFVPQEQAPQQQLLGGGNRVGDRFLVLAPDREDSMLLKEARALLSKQAEALGVPRERMPQPPRARPVPPPPPAGQAAFDPYKPFMTSTAPTPKGPQEQSLTDKRLQELLAKRADVMSGGVPDRNIQVTLPSRAAAAAATASSALGGGGRGGGSSGMGGGDRDGERGDGGLLAKKVARQIAERKREDEVPFQTKAMREIERLQKATVYRTTVIKVQFPDRVVLQATFASSEGVKDLLEVVKSSLVGDTSETRPFELYVSPPRVVLKSSSSLSDAGLVPAALVYVSWRDVPPTGEAEGGYLKQELTSGTATGLGAGAAAVRPVGVALDGGGTTGSEESKRGGAKGSNRVGGEKSAGGGSGGGKRAGKPSWLKIN